VPISQTRFTARPQVVLGQPALAVSCANPPGGRPVFSARIAFEDSEPKDIADTLSSAMVVGLPAVRAADPQPGRFLRGGQRAHGVYEVLVADLVHLPLGAERLLRLGGLGALVDQRADLPVERPPSVLRSTKYCWISGGSPPSGTAGGRPPGSCAAPSGRLHEVVDAERGQREQRPGGQPPPRVEADRQPERGERQHGDEAKCSEAVTGWRLSRHRADRRSTRRNQESGPIRCEIDRRRDPHVVVPEAGRARCRREAARRTAQKNPEKARELTDKAAAFADQRTKGKYHGRSSR